jgi:hypothetical protein
VGDIVTDSHILPGEYPLAFTVSSMGGKLTARLAPVV